jgi:DNA-binding response OmpR family regulator
VTGKRILLVEDDDDVAPLLMHVLIGEGYAVDLATTRMEAWRYLDAHRYDLVVADWRLPDGDGSVIADAGAELGAKTLVMSGYLFRMPGGRAERHQTLMKPIRPSELVDVVRRAIGPPRGNSTSAPSLAGPPITATESTSDLDAHDEPRTARILLVEDEREVRRLYEHILRANGYDVDATDTAGSAFELLAARDYDLVLADAKLEDGTGMMVGDKAQEHGTKTLIMTGYAFALPPEDLGRYEFLLKPVYPPELFAAIERALAQH